MEALLGLLAIVLVIGVPVFLILMYIRAGKLCGELHDLNKNMGRLLQGGGVTASDAAGAPSAEAVAKSEVCVDCQRPAEVDEPPVPLVEQAESVAGQANTDGAEEPSSEIPRAVLLPVQERPAIEEAPDIVQLVQAVREPAAAQDEASGSEPESKPEKTPRVPSAFELKVMRIANWFLFGTADVSDETRERKAATTWLLRGGILVILFASAFLLKLSIERGILSPAGRVCLSYLAGLALILWGRHSKMLTRYWGLGQAFIGMGFAILYFASFAMSALYHLESPYVSGIIMALVTVAAGLLAARLDTISIAFVALVGGFLTPALLNTGRVDLTGLGTYLLLLGAGVLALALVKEWLQLTWVAMLCTYVLYGLAAGKGASAAGQYGWGQVFLVLFFGLYSTTTIIYTIRKRLSVTALEVVTLLANSSLFFALSWWTIAHISSEKLVLAFLTVGMAVFYVAHVLYLARRKVAEDANLLRTFSGLAALYLALTFPMVFSSAWWSASWALQAVVLLWLGYRMDSRFLRGCAWALNVWMLLRFCVFDFGWVMCRQMNAQAVFTWSGCVERLFEFGLPILGLAASAWLSKRFQSQHKDAPIDVMAGAGTCRMPMGWVNALTLQAAVFSVAFGLGLLYLSLEVFRCLSLATPFRGAGLTILGLLGCLVALSCHRKALPGYWLKGFLPLLLLLMMFKIGFEFCSACVTGKLLFQNVWQSSGFWCAWTARMLNYGVMALALYILAKRLYDEEKIKLICVYAWPILLFIYSTAEWGTVIQHKLPGLSGGGISVLWALFAFAIVFRGLRRKVRWLRYAGLVFFTLIISKVFFFDISHLSAEFRVCSFLLFGALLIGSSFAYLRFWEEKEKNQK